MKAKRINERFKKREDPMKSLSLGYGKKLNTKGWKVLEFIEEAGEEGRSFTEIQKFIWVMNKKDPKHFDKEKVYGEGKRYWNPKKGKYEWEYSYEYQEGYRTSRGYWCDYLYGYGKIYPGLLHKWCKKNKKGKWVLERLPRPNEKLIGYD